MEIKRNGQIYKIKSGFIDCHIDSHNKEFGIFTLRTWWENSPYHGLQLSSEIIHKEKHLTLSYYYENHNIDDLLANNLANKLLTVRTILISTNE